MRNELPEDFALLNNILPPLIPALIVFLLYFLYLKKHYDSLGGIRGDREALYIRHLTLRRLRTLEVGSPYHKKLAWCYGSVSGKTTYGAYLTKEQVGTIAPDIDEEINRLKTQLRDSDHTPVEIARGLETLTGFRARMIRNQLWPGPNLPTAELVSAPAPDH